MNQGAVKDAMTIDLRDADVVIDALRRGADVSLNAANRRGGIVELPDTGTFTITGDLHDHTLNFQRILNLADLEASPDRYVVFHEVVHGPNLVNGYDLSIRTLARIAALKAALPGQVIGMLSNHELAQRNDEGILKDGTSVVKQFEEGVGFLYHTKADDVMDAVGAYIESLVVGVRCANGLFIAHSLPGPRKLPAFDPTLIDRVPDDTDLAAGGSAHLMVWGRRHNDELADALADAWGVETFVLGHQPVDMGYDTIGERIIIIESDDDHGVALPVDLARSYTLDDLCDLVRPLASVRLA